MWWLAKGHVKALNAIQNNCGVEVYNLGTGKGYSVLGIVKAFERVNDVKIPYVIDDRRPEDIATLILVKRGQSLAGKQNTALKRCVGIAGTGSVRIRMDILNN